MCIHALIGTTPAAIPRMMHKYLLCFLITYSMCHSFAIRVPICVEHNFDEPFKDVFYRGLVSAALSSGRHVLSGHVCLHMYSMYGGCEKPDYGSYTLRLQYLPQFLTVI